jgi:hypothetical protein
VVGKTGELGDVVRREQRRDASGARGGIVCFELTRDSHTRWFAELSATVAEYHVKRLTSAPSAAETRLAMDMCWDVPERRFLGPARPAGRCRCKIGLDSRIEPHTGMSVWLRDHADHHMAVLLSADGPFKGCKPDNHGERLAPLPTSAPPDGRATLR